MSALVGGESTTGKDGSLMSFVPHRMQDLKPVEDCQCCISQHLQFEANGTKKVTNKQKKSHN